MKSHFNFLSTVTLFGLQYILGQSPYYHKQAICKDDSVMLNCGSDSLIFLQDVQLVPESGKQFHKEVCFKESKTMFLRKGRSKCNAKRSCEILDDLVVALAKCVKRKQNSFTGNCTIDENIAGGLCWLDNAIKDVKPSNACRAHSECRKKGTIFDAYCQQESFSEIHWMCQRDRKNFWGFREPNMEICSSYSGNTCVGESPETTPTSLKTIALAVSISIVGIIMVSCIFVLWWRRYKFKNKDPKLQMNNNAGINKQERHYTDTTTTDSDVTIHQQNRLSSKPISTMHIDLEGSNCNLQDFSSKRCLNKDNPTHNYEDIDVDIDNSPIKLDTDGSECAYFILEPTEQSDSRGKSVNIVAEQYDALNWNKKSSLHQVDAYADKDKHLYGISADGLYNVSSHERIITANETYDHFNKSSY